MERINWKHSPTHTFEKKVSCHVEKLRTLYLLFLNAAAGQVFADDGMAAGVIKIMEEGIEALDEFRAELPEAIKKMISDNQFKGRKKSSVPEKVIPLHSCNCE